MTSECQTDLNKNVEREVRLYYFTVYEVASILRCNERNIYRTFKGKMIWYEGRWMISPSDIQQMRKTV